MRSFSVTGRGRLLSTHYILFHHGNHIYPIFICREVGIPTHCCHWVSPQYYAECLSYVLDQDQSSEEVSDSDTS